MPRRGKAVACLVAAVLVASLSKAPRLQAPSSALITGCFADDCGYTNEEVPSIRGHFIDADTWESVAVDGVWDSFGGSKEMIYWPDFGGRVPYDWSVNLSVSDTPVADGNWISDAAGNIALIRSPLPNRFAIYNGTCSQYYVRVVIRAKPFPPAPVDLDASDAGDPTDARDGDAADLDANADASDAGL